MSKPTKIAFVKFAGLSAGGTERSLQTEAAFLPKAQYEVDYYWCDPPPSDKFSHPQTDPMRIQFMRDHGINLIQFHVGAQKWNETFDWIDTDFWRVFKADKYALVKTAKAGPAEYPFYLIDIPVIERIALDQGVDHSKNIVWSICPTHTLRDAWIGMGGREERSSVIPIPVSPPATTANMRDEFGISKDALVAGFHQQVNDDSFSEIPLEAFSCVSHKDRHFIVMGGSNQYRKQVRRLDLCNVHFVEHSASDERISRFLNSLDIFAHGRRNGETFGAVFAEAMVHGLPCLSHRANIGSNAHKETMGPGGLFAEDRIDYTHKLAGLFREEAQRKRLGAAGRLHAQRHYSIEASMVKRLQLYERVLRGFRK